MPAILITLLPLLVELAGLIIKHFVKDEALVAQYEVFKEQCRADNIKGIIERRNSAKRLKANNDKLDQIEAEEKAKKLKGKK